jgi:cyclopropane-fatty-acyl-phospholipid synthase
VKASGTSRAAIESHYDVSDEFFALWLGPELTYSCALWNDGDDDLPTAQLRKLDHFARHLDVRGRRVLDIGCGWGSLLERFARSHGATSGVGLTLSPTQVRFALARDVANVEYRLEHWADHEPTDAYEAITCIEATEHLASDSLDADAKVDVYRSFFETCASWLRSGGRFGLQLICLDNVGHAGSRAGRGPLSELVRTTIFPESMPASLSELALGWETHFRLRHFLDHSHHYVRTFRAWALAERAARTRARDLVASSTVRAFERYFAVGEVVFRLREHALYRVVLEKRPQPKTWAVAVRPSDVADGDGGAPGPLVRGASTAAVRTHYDVSNEFYELWLGPTMMYSSGRWSAGDGDGTLDDAQNAKIDYFAAATGIESGATVLDVGCGWGYALRRFVERHGAGRAVGLTPSAAQIEYAETQPVRGVEPRLERWEDHVPSHPYDAIVSFGAFEHFAPDGSRGPARVGAYRAFFARCYDWLVPDGRLGLETIAHDDAPDTDAPLGRGPLGDVVLRLYPESLCPHLSELLMGCEPWFELVVLESAAADFARTTQKWTRNLREHEAAAGGLIGTEAVRAFWRYLVASDVQFRLNAITNYRVVLRRRPAPRW